MASKVKEDERIERIIRGLLKLPENKRCINCNSLGPQYVCTTFLTFVCTNCSGIHREFTHRVKSVSMAKFTAEEVSSLQAGGNERARQIYLKDWDPQRHSYPDGSNLHRIRDFIKHVYEDRKYTGERSVEKLLPRLKLGDKESSHENKMVIAHQGGSRSPYYEEKYEKSHSARSSPGGRSSDGSFRYYYDERRSPRYAQQNSRSGGFRRNPVRFEVVDDRIRDDRFGSRRRSDSHGLSNGESRLGSRSPDHQKNINMPISPAVRPAKDILGENALPLQVGELSKANYGKAADGSAHNQKIASSSNVGSIDGNPKEHNKASSESLIDLSTNPEPPDSAAAPQTQQKPISPFRSSAKENAPQAPNLNTLEFLLSELSVPSVPPVNNTSKLPSSDDASSAASGSNMPAGGISLATAPAQHLSMLPDNVDASTTASTTDAPAQPFNGDLLNADPYADSNVKVSDGQQLPNMQQHHLSVSPATDSGSITATPVAAVDNEPQTSSLAPNVQGPFSVSAEQSIQTVSKPAQDTSTGAGSQPLSVETKSSGRKELPADLFTASYSSVLQPVPGWQTHPPHDMGFSMQYYPKAMPAPAFPHASRSTNPFDINVETDQDQVQVHSPMFPSMKSLQRALPNISAPSGILRTVSLDSFYQGSMRPQSPSFVSGMPPKSPSFASVTSPMTAGAYKGQQVYNNMPPSRPQGISGFGSGGAVFGALNTNQQMPDTYSGPITPNSFASKGRNPFG